MACSNTLKENAFLVGTLMTLTSFLPTKTFSRLSSPHHVRLAFLLKRLFYVVNPKVWCPQNPCIRGMSSCRSGGTQSPIHQLEENLDDIGSSPRDELTRAARAVILENCSWVLL